MMMKLFDQLTLSDKATGTHGDCMRACVNTILQMDYSLPHPINDDGEGWNLEFFDMIENIGFDLLSNPFRDDKDWSFLPRIVIAAGPTIRTEETGNTHAVVWDMLANRCIHDPHPSRAGLIGITWFYWFET